MVKLVGRNVRIKERTLEKLARILAVQYGIKVIFKNDQCFTTGRTIYLPAIPPNADEDFLKALEGYLDHEVAHILFSDFEVAGKAKKIGAKLHTLTNMLEDVRVEHLMIQQWRGCRINLKNCHEWTRKQLVDSFENLSDFGKFTLGVGIYCTTKEDYWFSKFIQEKVPEIWDRIKSVKDLLVNTHLLPSSQEAMWQAQKIMDRIQEEEDKDEKDDKNEEGQQGQQKGDGAKGSSPQPSTGPNNPSQTDSEDDNSVNSCNKDGGSASKGDPNTSSTNIMKTDDKDVLDDDMQTASNNLVKKAAKQHFQEIQRPLCDLDYAILTTEHDRIEKCPDGDKKRTQQFLEESREITNAVRQKFRMNLLSRKKSGWETDKLRGRLNTRALHRIVTGKSKRVFKRQVVTESFNTRCALWIDHSQSMYDGRIELASQTALVFGECLDDINVPFEICGYSTASNGIGHQRYHDASDEEKQVFTRWGDLWIGVYKDYNEPWKRVRHRCLNMESNVKYNAYDGESIRIAAERLLAHKEERLILFVLSDGEPCPNVWKYGEAHERYLKEAAKEVESAIEVFALGMQTNSVREFYKNNVVMNNLEEIPQVVLTELDRLLRKGQNAYQRVS